MQIPVSTSGLAPDSALLTDSQETQVMGSSGSTPGSRDCAGSTRASCHCQNYREQYWELASGLVTLQRVPNSDQHQNQLCFAQIWKGRLRSPA